jgi:DNA-directed RNA polymerase specialized sigma24 family protein
MRTARRVADETDLVRLEAEAAQRQLRGPGPTLSEIAQHAIADIGRDGPLVVAVVLLGFSQKEAAEALGLSHDVARKRFQRALDALHNRHGDF